MDEGLAVYFTHRLMDHKYGKNNKLITFPAGLGWLPNIHRDDYRYTSMSARWPAARPRPPCSRCPASRTSCNLMAATYDRGSKIVGMIEDRMGEDGFFDFMRHVYEKYQYRILRVADFRRELEAYTGRSWEEFFHELALRQGDDRLGLEKVQWTNGPSRRAAGNRKTWSPTWSETFSPRWKASRPCVPSAIASRSCCDKRANTPSRRSSAFRSTTAPTTRCGSPSCRKSPCSSCGSLARGRDAARQLRPRGDRAPLRADADRRRSRPGAARPQSDEQLLEAAHPLAADAAVYAVGRGRPHQRLRPLEHHLRPVGLRCHVQRPWYTRPAMAGLRIGAYRTQEFSGGAYVAYRSDDRNVVAGVDALWDHILLPNMQVGFNIERSLTTWDDDDHEHASRGVLFERYVMLPGSSFYLPPFEYVEAFEAVQSNPLPVPSEPSPGAMPFHQQTLTGLHYHINLVTPYWNPEGGFMLDTTYAEGLPCWASTGPSRSSTRSCRSSRRSATCWASAKTSRSSAGWAIRDWRRGPTAADAIQDEAQIFTLGGGDMFRGYS